LLSPVIQSDQSTRKTVLLAGTAALVFLLTAGAGQQRLSAADCAVSNLYQYVPVAQSSSGGECTAPKVVSVSYELETASCDPHAGPCTVRAKVRFEFPNASGNIEDPWMFWFNTAEAPACDPGFGPPPTGNCPAVAACGIFGTFIIREDFADTWVRIPGITCETAATNPGVRSVHGWICPINQHNLVATQNGILLGGPQMSAAIGCEPPKDNCNDCKATTAGSVDNGGGGSCHKSSGGGPGATLRYRSRGAGHPGFPGAASHSPPLGRHWSHDYAQRIVPDPNEAHVWLITETASFREFSDLVGGVYETNSPSDEYRELRWTNPGWELHDLDGTVMVFDGDGKWTQTIKPAGPATAKTATYNTSDQLESVAFPDGRREDFIYYPAPPEIAGKLWTITEVGVDGTTTRVWTYGWNADGDLTSIVRPDGSTLSYTYHPTHPGFLIREELEPAGGGQKRVLRAWDYDTPGRVTKVWRGHVDFANGVDGWQLAYTSPTTTEITDPLGNTSTYTYDQDPGSTTTRITQIEGDCPACGLGPNSVFEYTDPDNPLQPTAIIDGRGIRTELSYDENGEDRGLLTSKIEAVGTAEQRATWWEYTDSRFPGLPTAIVQESVEGLPTERRTDIVYHAVGAPQSRTISGVERGVSFSHSTTFDYNAAGQPIWIDPPGFGTTDRTSFGYTPPSGEPDRNGMLPFTRTDPLVGDIADTAFAYDAFNRRIAVTDPNGVTMETQYDELDRGTKTIHRTGTLGIDFNLGDAPQAGDLVTESLYNVFGDLEQTILPKLIVIEYGYDSAGRLESIARRLNTASPIAECTSFVLDGTGNREREELWKGECYTGTSTSFTMFHYKNRLQLEKIQYADGAVTEYAYDANGNLEKVWDANHPKGDPPATPSQTYVYDELNRLREVHQPWGGGTRPVCQMGDSQAEAVTRYS
jgi:YD repeat-containing protein